MSLEESFEFENGADDEQGDGIQIQNLRDAVVAATDWTTETILTQLQRGNIQLTPRFQRRDAWDITRKSRFVESLLLGLPVPQLVLAEQLGQRGKFLVLDGKQRLLSLLQFSGHGEGRNNSFALQGLDVRKDLQGVTYQQMSNDPARQEDVNCFLNQTIRTVVIRNWPNNDFLYVVFVRLNTGSVQLSPQELRQALHPGPFTEYVDDKSCESESLKRLLGLKEPDFRMRDSEILLRHLAFRNFMADYNGNLKQFLDETCRRLNEGWEQKSAKIESQVAEFEAATACCFDLFGIRHVARRWNNGHFQGLFNRAIFDVLSFYFAKATIRSKSLQAKEDVVECFKRLCNTSPEFIQSVTSTTKSISATFNRYLLWGQALQHCLGDGVVVPSLVDNRIVFEQEA